MTSTFTWLDYSERERRQMLDVISQFREQDTRDELGLGSVRDAFADLFFPGTSTIQTRARYFLFVPWIYRNLENKWVAADKVAQRARNDEIKLIYALLESDDQAGVIGKDAKEKLQRLPSNVYWQGLGVWGVRTFPGSQAQYHRRLDTFYALAQRPQLNDDGEPLSGGLRANWHFELPPAPDDFPAKATFQLTRPEAEYLQERILTQVPRTLLAWLVDRGRQTEPVEFPWKHPQFADFPDRIREQLDQARNFSEAIFGASLLYNLLLSKLAQKEELMEDYRAGLADWAQTITDRQAELTRWASDLTKFWDLIAPTRIRVTLPTKRFIEQWLTIALQPGSATRVADQSEARALIREREKQLKRALARLDNPRALELWNGAAGAYRLDYRWGVSQALLNDILTGLKTGGDHA
jgi:hypothetical protein